MQNPNEELLQQFKKLSKQVKALGVQKKQALYIERDLRPNPFDKSLYMPPFPRHFEAPRFQKYRGKGNPIDHIQEFCASCIKLSDEPTYLMRFFLHSLGGPALKWYSKLPGNIKSWSELVDKFISHFSFNITNEVTLSNLCSTKQKIGKSFITFLLRWRSFVSQCPLDIPEEQQVNLCIENLVSDLMYELKIKSPSTISKLMKKGLVLKMLLFVKESSRKTRTTPIPTRLMTRQNFSPKTRM